MATNIKKKPITRNRETLTCLQCRARKLKCDKELPCASCVKRNDGGSCSYVKTGAKKEPPESTRAAKAEARLQHLEQLIEEYATRSEGPGPGSHPSDGSNGTSGTNGSNGNSIANGDSHLYTGATHYSAMLDGIEELRQLLHEDEPGSANSPSSKDSISDETDVLFGSTPRLPLTTVLANNLPSKLEVDRRLAAYFRAQAISAACIHTPQFMRQYDEFWWNQTATSPLWISILFSMLHLSNSVGRGSWSERTNGDSPEPKYNFSLAAAHCLALGRYHRPQRFAVESLAVYVQAKVIETLDPSPALGLLFGTLIQSAYSMGYHREPTNFKNLTPFEGEMRRRTWSFAMQLDLLIMFQLGLPNTVQFGSWDTRPPSNLQDTDFDEDTAVLPPPRPDTEPTRVTFYTAKHMLMKIFDKILRHSLSVGEIKPEHDLLALHQELVQTYDSIPAVLHYRNVSSSISDPAYLVVTRKCVELMYQKCLCVLHRKHVLSGRQDSIRVCYDAASQVVKAFLDMYPEFKPGGQFFEDRWLLGSITWTDWLLAVMTLSLVLCQLRRAIVPGFTEAEYNNILHLLRSANEICLEKIDESVAGRRSARMLQALLAQETNGQKVMNGNGTTPSLDTPAQVAQTSVPALSEGDYDMWQQNPDLDILQGWSDPYSNVFETQEWAFLEQCMNADFQMQ
ncbi:hypothetical protein M409DRAFT_29099 [Zasmidium cellare ATCC 36951]|uniref:Zn(2)-C6 fungal-type domain-containing protein n=1 Tax=Zasmidium cellare ATCC 36951 TaxID=1080233 RepID=A0A6A6C2H4_ZASCE|nr:uncharacterized protein M409DRAFT_29099 [Zasmidium cellare ATCC 36951]KAF2160478.1 hypothetical protein M409DRAFT_29099 [Zasmidium cellare ATCC 36951]